MRTSRLLIGYILSQGVALRNQNHFVDANVVIESIGDIQKDIEDMFVVNNIKLTPIGKKFFEFQFEDHNFICSEPLLLDLDKEYDLLVKELEPAHYEIFGYELTRPT